MAMKTVSEIFGSMVFGDDAMKKYLPKEAYKRLQETIKNGRSWIRLWLTKLPVR